MLHSSGLPALQGHEISYTILFFITVLAPINIILSSTLQSLSAFLTGIVMNQHLLVPKHSGVFPETSL